MVAPPALVSNRIEMNYYDAAKSKANYVSTTKYKWWSFVFVFTFQQYQKFSNVFYMAQALCNLIPGVTVVSPITAFLPVVFVLLVAAFREIIEDIARMSADSFQNN